MSTQTIIWQTVDERVAQIAAERSWNDVKFGVDQTYPGWRREDIKDYQTDEIPKWVKSRLNVFLKDGLPIREIILFHEPEKYTPVVPVSPWRIYPVPPPIPSMPPPIPYIPYQPSQPSLVDRAEKALGISEMDENQKVLAIIGIVVAGLLIIPLIFGLVFLVGLAAACSSGDPACVIVVDDGTPEGTWIEIGRWI